MADDILYVVTDAEFDGPLPGDNSMLSFASVAVAADGRHVDEFEAVLTPLPGATRDAGTMAWFATQPEALAAATRDPRPPAEVMERFAGWVRALPGRPVFAAHPLALDGPWLELYLRRFTGHRLIAGPRDEAPLFALSGLCLRSFAAARLGWPLERCHTGHYPPAWLGNVPHTHRAIDDARGYANLLGYLMKAPMPAAAP